MRLIIVDAFLERERQIQNGTVEAQLEVFEQYRVPRVDYCILSHRWTDSEVTYEEMRRLTRMDNRDEIRSRAGYRKVLRSCEQAKHEGFRLLWVDTCCVDLLNSPEMSDAINSMFQWYRKSKQCYAYLHDVSVFPTRPNNELFGRIQRDGRSGSRGAGRLQELVAPEDLQFFNKDWKCIGDKRSLAPKLAGNHEGPLKHLCLEGQRDMCNARWSNGVLADDPELFQRLVTTVIKMEPKEFYKGLLLLWESDAKELVTSQDDDGIPTFTVTNGAIQIRLPLLPYYGCPSVFLAALACRRESDSLPMTIGLASFGSNYYRYSGATGPLPLFPQYRQLYLAYRDERLQDITFKPDDRTAPYYGFTHRDVFPGEVSLVGDSLTLSNTSPLAIDWVHVICDEQGIDVEKVHRRVWNAGAEYARVMAEVRFGKSGRPYYVKHEPLPRTIWTVRVICGGLEESSDRRVTVDVVPLPGGYWKTRGWEPVYDIEDNSHMPCLMKKTSWIGGRFDSHTLLVDSMPKVFDLAHALQVVKLGDYGTIASDASGMGHFELQGNIFDDLKSHAHELGIDPDDPGLMPVVHTVHGPHEGSGDTTSDDVTTELTSFDGVNAGLTLRQPRSLSLPNTQPILILLKELSTRIRNYSLVTTVVQCSSCYPTDGFKLRINSAVPPYPKFWQNYTASDLYKVSNSLYTVTPLYTVSDPWVWYRCGLDAEVAEEYRRIREQFGIIQGHLPRHQEDPKEPAFKFLKDLFGVEHLECVTSTCTWVEKPPGNTPGAPKTCVEQLVIMLLRAMKGVTHAFQMRQSSRMVEMMHVTCPIMTTLGVEFLADISTAFLGAKDVLDDIKSTDGKKRNSCEANDSSVQSLVDEVVALQTQYHKSMDDVERLALEQDIVGTILLVCHYGISLEIQQTIRQESPPPHFVLSIVPDAKQAIDGILRYETTDMSANLPERKERVNCLHFVGEIFEDAFSDVPPDNHFHLRWPMGNAKARISMHKLYLATRVGWKVGGAGSIQSDWQGSSG
ncbi:hypothetical protein F5J12DRAFT_780389 [Pisolithus orientalis]|uniref:uncharacterized protein n=1 Tax=Pisolithus orientalis TaxID=936130 RepID=UPI002224DAC3|nr:uncharacterized protein F5J12DRAFT_780389 [Pisolithus orientalis]KAI6028864.1 hypothetical protein F5J12DRAFT_780389 [Pisolithus orientalis]